MQIEYLGHSAFLIEGENATIVTDPYHEMLGSKFPKVAADIVTISHDQASHNNAEGVRSKEIKFVVNGPGEYEIRGVSIFGTQISLDTIYLIELDGLSLCHLGALNKTLTPEQVEDLDGVDVLFIPVGNKESLEAKVAVEVINQIEPLIVIPMHYDSKELEKFVHELGVENVRREKKITIKKSNLPQEREIVVLA